MPFVVVAAFLGASCGTATGGALGAAPILTVDGREPAACGVAANLSVLTAEPGAEKADTPEAAALREVARTGIAGMSFPPANGWVVLARNEDEVTFGHREGEVGIGHVVTVRREGADWTFANSGGCGPFGYDDGRRAAHIDTYKEEPGELLLQWTGGTCDDGSAPHVAVSETDEAISVLLVPPADSDGACAGVGTSESTPVALESPVAGRRVENVGYLPVRIVPSGEQYVADQQAEGAAYAAAEVLCNRGAAELGSAAAEVVYSIDVATVRRYVQATKQPWGSLPPDAIAGHCYLERDDGRTWAYVVVDGAPTVAYDKDYDRGGLYVRLDG